jgi:hypothetical protein
MTISGKLNGEKLQATDGGWSAEREAGSKKELQVTS